MPAKKSGKSTKRRASARQTKRTTKRHRQTDVWGESLLDLGKYPGGEYVSSAIDKSRSQGRVGTSAYSLRSADPVPVVPTPVSVAVPEAAASTSADAVAQQRPVRLAMQRILRELK